MKNIVLLLSLVFVIVAFDSDYAAGKVREKKFRIFRVTLHAETIGENDTLMYDTVRQRDKPIDIHFMKRHFDLPKHLPDELRDAWYKDSTVSVLVNDTDAHGLAFSYTRSYKYDSLSRITYYSYSGCGSCSDMPYEYNVEYDEKHRPRGMERVSELGENDFKEYYGLHYNDKDELNKMEYYRMGRLFGEIMLVE